MLKKRILQKDELNKFVQGVMDVSIDDTPEQTISFQPSMSLMSGPKLYISVQFDLCEFKPYKLSCMIDSGC